MGINLSVVEIIRVLVIFVSLLLSVFNYNVQPLRYKTKLLHRYPFCLVVRQFTGSARVTRACRLCLCF